jgi:hypothetical protein
MKKFLTTLIFASLAILVMANLYKVMLWDGLAEMSLASIWLHIGSYLAYALLVHDKDSRIVFPMGALVIFLIFNMLHILTTNIFVILGLLVAYVAYHLVTPHYLGKSNLPYIGVAGVIGLFLIVIGSGMKIMHWPWASELFIIGSGLTAFILLLTGSTKGLERKQ